MGVTILKTGIRDVEFGDDVKVVEPVNIYGCKIGSHCFVGPFVEIQNDVVIGQKTRIQSHTFVCELVSIGEECFIAHGVMFINYTFQNGEMARGRRELFRSTSVGDRVYIGSNSTILPVSICSDVVIGAGSVVTKDITKPGIYAGNPAKFLRQAK